MDIAFVQNLHSGVRWLVVLAGAVALVRFAVGLMATQPYDAIGRISMSVLNALLGIQFVIGLVLIFWKGIIVGTAQYWGYAWGHGIVMIAVLGVAGATSGRVKRAATDQQKWRIGTIGLLIVAVLVIVGVMAVNGW
jgi:hypothetical protein